MQKAKNFADAAKLYEEAIGHARLLGGVDVVEKQYRAALAGLAHCRIQIAVALQEKNEFKLADAEVEKLTPFDPQNKEVADFKRFNDKVEAAHRGRLPSKQVLTSRTETMQKRTETMTMVQDGRAYYELHQFKEARQRLEKAIEIDPLNDTAYYYLRLIMESEFEEETRRRENTYAKRVVEVTREWNRLGHAELPSPNPYYMTNHLVPFLTHTSKGAQRINRKLDEIVFPEITYDGLPLPEVLKLLDADTKKHDPEKKGLNFLINSVAVDYISANAGTGGGPGGPGGPAAPLAPTLDPVTGQPIGAAPGVGTQRPDLDSAMVKVTSVLKDLTLRQTLDVICKTTEVKMPDGRAAGLKFSIEEYAIVFSPKLPEQASLFMRMFKVNPDTFMQGLQSVVANPIQSVSSGGGQGGQQGGGGGGGG
ncbi:MAG: tetratricopeptide repeat protein, partial [Limisphaerales bacterium]